MRGQFAVSILHNPSAGDGQIAASDLRAALEGDGVRVRYASLKESGWDDLIDERCDMLVVAGGDGAVRKVAIRALARGLGDRVPLALLPFGTANNIARSVGAGDDPSRALRDLAESLRETPRSVVKRSFDVLSVRARGDSTTSLESVGAGLLARVLRHLESDRNEARLRYHADAMDVEAEDLLVGALAWRDVAATSEPLHCRVTLDDRVIDEPLLFAAAVNSRSIGPLIAFDGDAACADGMFEMVLVHPDDRTGFLDFLDEVIAALRDQRPAPAARAGAMTVVRAAGATIRAAGSEIHIDDSLLSDSDLPTADKRAAGSDAATVELNVGVIRSALRLWVPAGSPALSLLLPVALAIC
jgi:diacylglycerol kinase (ATP)